VTGVSRAESVTVGRCALRAPRRPAAARQGIIACFSRGSRPGLPIFRRPAGLLGRRAEGSRLGDRAMCAASRSVGAGQSGGKAPGLAIALPVTRTVTCRPNCHPNFVARTSCHRNCCQVSTSCRAPPSQQRPGRPLWDDTREALVAQWMLSWTTPQVGSRRIG